uniref:Uncharacterized protein n=1 Tax=Lactuca sativa TaxID=4236 RepID=A0A9R1UFH8_LACSA|nr:hypothetical protein LSAT_V11C900494300 [Lactuca sativa]
MLYLFRLGLEQWLQEMSLEEKRNKDVTIVQDLTKAKQTRAWVDDSPSFAGFPTIIDILGNKINLNEISHESAMGLVKRVLDMGYLLTEMIQLTRDRALRNWVFDEIAENMHREFGSRYP